MRNLNRFGLLGLVVVGWVSCGGGGGGSNSTPTPIAPAAPTGLASTGSLGHIALRWTASSSSGVSGYNVYRSTVSGVFAKLNSSPVGVTTYDDGVPSPTSDGVIYTYQVTAVASNLESIASGTVSDMQGTRPPTNPTSGFTTTTTASPYVIDSSCTVDGGGFTVATGTALYLRPGATLSLADAATLTVNGLLRAVGTATAPATINGHGFPAATASVGIRILFDGAVNYNATSQQGTVLDHTLLKNLVSGNYFTVTNCAPAFIQAKFLSNDPPGRTYLALATGCGLNVSHCSFTGVVPTIVADLRAQSSFGISQSSFMASYYAIYFGPLNTPGVASGQINGNSFDASGNGAVIYFVLTTTDVPLGGNYWSGGTGAPPLPVINMLGITNPVTLNFNTALGAAPTGVGANW